MIEKAFALGLSTGVFCMGYCAPVLTGLLFSRQHQTWKDNAKSLALFLSGRLLAYLAFGIIAYGMGELFRGRLFFVRLFPLGEIFLGLLMFIFCINMSFPHWKFCNISLKWQNNAFTLFAAGIFTGINLCPPFILAVGTAVHSGTLANSLLFFLIFFIATSIWLLPFVFSGIASRSENIRTAARIVCGLTGIWFFISGIRKLILY